MSGTHSCGYICFSLGLSAGKRKAGQGMGRPRDVLERLTAIGGAPPLDPPTNQLTKVTIV